VVPLVHDLCEVVGLIFAAEVFVGSIQRRFGGGFLLETVLPDVAHILPVIQILRLRAVEHRFLLRTAERNEPLSPTRL